MEGFGRRQGWPWGWLGVVVARLALASRVGSVCGQMGGRAACGGGSGERGRGKHVGVGSPRGALGEGSICVVLGK